MSSCNVVHKNINKYYLYQRVQNCVLLDKNDTYLLKMYFVAVLNLTNHCYLFI